MMCSCGAEQVHPIIKLTARVHALRHLFAAELLYAWDTSAQSAECEYASCASW